MRADLSDKQSVAGARLEDDVIGLDVRKQDRDGGDVDHLERRIGRAFEEEQLGVGPHRGAPRLEVAAVDQGRGSGQAHGSSSNAPGKASNAGGVSQVSRV